MSAREVKRRREGWVREGIVYEYIAAVPAKRAAVESKSVFSHRNRIGNALTIYTSTFTAHVVNGDVSRRSPRRVRTPRVVLDNALVGARSAMRLPDVSPETLARWLRLALGPLALRSARRRERRPRARAETGTSENTSPSSRTPSRAPRAGASSCRTPAGPEPPRARPDDAESSRSAPRGSSSGRRVRAALRHRERRKAGAVARVCHDTDDTPTPDRRF